MAVALHSMAGNRLFPGTMTFDEPAVADEFLIPPSSLMHPLDITSGFTVLDWKLEEPSQQRRNSDARGWSGYPPKLPVKADIPDGKPSANARNRFAIVAGWGLS
jgi:hypothetical protein